MSPIPRTIDEHRRVLEAARDALGHLREALPQAFGAQLGELVRLVDDVAALAGAARAGIAVEAVSRGIPAETGQSTQVWIREHAPSQRQAGVRPLAVLVGEMAGATALTGEACLPDPESPRGMVWARTCTGEVAPPLAMAALAEIDRLAPRLVPDAVPTVTTALLDLGVAWGPTMMRRLRPRLLADHGRPGELDAEQERLAPSAFLSAPQVESGDLTEYRMGLTPEQATVMEAALGPLCAPRPNDETGERDLRSNGQRRIEALIELCRRAVRAGVSRGGPAESTSAVYVTVGLEALQSGTGAGEVLGSSAAGTLLSPAVLRRMCCDADIIPTVLGAQGEQLDLGRSERLFTRPQRRAVWHRDRGCTYPGCSAPAAWTQVHHIHHWLDGGGSDLDNAALLCQRHHTHVHRRRLWGDVRQTPDDHGRFVVWDLTPGSYDARSPNQTRQEPWVA
jgi:hypothetical protein